MVKSVAIVLAILIVLGMTGPAYAKVAKGSHKLEKGFIGLVTAPIEVPKHIYRASKESNPLIGLTIGTFKGAISFVTKALSGVFNIVTCPFGPVMEAEVFPEEKAELKK